MTTVMQPGTPAQQRDLFLTLYQSQYNVEQARWQGGRGLRTRLSTTCQVEPGGLFKMAGRLFASQAKKQLEADMQRLKELLEAWR